MIKYPVRVEQGPDATFAHIRDATDRVVAGGMSREDAEEIVEALNAYGVPQRRKKSRAQKTVEELRASDLTAQAVGRTDVEYGLHDSLPRGEHVANLRKV